MLITFQKKSKSPQTINIPSKQLLLLLLLLYLCSVSSHAVTDSLHFRYSLKFKSGDFYYDIKNNGSAVLTYYSPENDHATTDLILPEELDGYPLVEIAAYAFERNCSVVSLTIPGSVKKIDKAAFFQCEKLSEVIMYEGVIIVEEAAFDECYELMMVSLPNSAIVINGNPFVDCHKLVTITVQNNHPTLMTIDGVLIDKINDRLISFPGGLRVENYSIPEGIKEIADSAFLNHPYLKEVSFPVGVVILGDSAFQLSAITEICLPDSVVEIGNHTFAECYSLEMVKLSYDLEEINDCAFACCPELKTIILPKSIDYIGYDAFDRGTISLTVYPNSFAEKYAIEREYDYSYFTH